MSILSSRSVLQIMDARAIFISQAYQLARYRLASVASPVLRMTLERDALHAEVQWLKRELEIHQQQRANTDPHQRDTYFPEQRLAILQLMRVRGWSAAYTARQFVLIPNTVRRWIKTLEGGTSASSLLPRAPWNRIDDAVRWAVHELWQLCPEPELGTRTIGRYLTRAGIQISRRSVQRILREPKPASPDSSEQTKTRKSKPLNPPAGVKPHNLLAPTSSNQVWHMDMMTVGILWFTFTVAVILDGATRRILCLHVFGPRKIGPRKTPNSQQMLGLVRKTVKQYGTPKHIITDHGVQFRRQFKQGLKELGIRHVRRRVRTPNFNGKIERFFKTLRIWQRSALLFPTQCALQQRLDRYPLWYNTVRVHQALGGLTPEEAWNHIEPAEPVPIRAADRPPHTHIRIQRSNFKNDVHLPVIKITLTRHAA